MQQTANQADSDFLNTLLSASVKDSPVWSPNPSDSGISEDPPSDQVDSPQGPESPQGDVPYFAPRSKKSPDSNFPTDCSESQVLKQQSSFRSDYARYRSVSKTE